MCLSIRLLNVIVESMAIIHVGSVFVRVFVSVVVVLDVRSCMGKGPRTRGCAMYMCCKMGPRTRVSVLCLRCAR